MKKSFYLITIVFFLLLASSTFLQNFWLFGLVIKTPDILSDINSDKLYNTISTKPVVKETGYADDSAKTVTCYISDFRKDGLMPLEKFNKALKKTEKDKTITRIAFLGDSMIEGDLITQTLRDKLQHRFGGKGVGYMPIVSQTAHIRESIHHKYSSNWSVLSITKNLGDRNLGLSGYVFKPKGISSVKYEAPKNISDNLNQFNIVKLYFGKNNPEDYITFSGNNIYLNGATDYNQLILNDSIPVTEAELIFHCSYNTNIYGVSFESPEGVILDNYSVRGNTGIPLIGLSQSLLRNTDSVMQYSLIILQYGLNIVEPETKDLSFYAKTMIPAVNNLKECFPNADILIMSVSDKCYKRGGSYITEPSVPLIIQAQEEISKETGCAFWNLFQTMGGDNSMENWVSNNLANKDYTHFNISGAEKVGTYFYDQLMYIYVNYVKTNK